jgi:hypothetical protein
MPPINKWHGFLNRIQIMNVQPLDYTAVAISGIEPESSIWKFAACILQILVTEYKRF